MHHTDIALQGPSLFKAFHCGIERESLRIAPTGALSKLPHPKALGSPLTHPYISNDFSKQQVEWNTPPFPSFQKTLHFMEELLHFSSETIKEELFWPYSMPPFLDQIEIAHFGSSHEGKRKELYRMGLKKRYGAKFQMISGMHVNLSFDPIFWEKRQVLEKSPLSLRDFIDEKSLAIIRNFLREGWLLTYLFGASPAIDPHYMPSLPTGFIAKEDFCYAPYATSIRNSEFGYYSRVQNQLAISFNTLSAYLTELKRALSTPKKEYLSIGTQLNPYILQIENEHYSRIRPKRVTLKGETPLQALEKRGIEYLEIRSFDLSPYQPIGLSLEELRFTHLFLLYCLFKKSPPLSGREGQCLTNNQNQVAIQGRRPNLILNDPSPILLKTWGYKILEKLTPLASLLGYEKTLAAQKEKLDNPDKCPSSLLLQSFLKEGFKKTLLLSAQSHKNFLLKLPLSEKKKGTFETLAQKSHIETKRLETASSILVEGHETLELSTQVLIREALKKNIQVRRLDDTKNLLRLEREGHIEYVQEATKTSKDTYITFHLLKNKHVTKILLAQHGLSVPDGKRYSNREAILADYPQFQNKKIVVKPNDTNFGIGIYFIEPGDQKGFAAATKRAFKFGHTLLVEEYFPGEEFRFLVIDKRIVAIAKREPANVIGNGTQTIRALIRAKNRDPFYYRDPKSHIRLGAEEMQMLRKQKLTPQTVLPEGKKIYLRRNSNISTGGDPIDVTDEIHAGYHPLAIRAANALGAKICGVDMLISDPQISPNKENYRIIELNYNPVLFIHAHPYKGKKRNVAGPILDLLGYPEKP